MQSVAREEPQSGGEKSAKCRFHAAAVRHRSIKQKQANGRFAGHQSGSRMMRIDRIIVRHGDLVRDAKRAFADAEISA